MKFLFQPTKNFKIFQKFAENQACSFPDKTGISGSLVDGTCPVGKVKLYPLLGMPKGHTGLDIQAYTWQNCYASQDGVVTEIQTEEPRGLGVSIVTNDKYFCTETGQPEYFVIRYWHFIGFNVDLGEKVSVGDIIGYCDNTGFSSGSHLHLELKPVKKDKKGKWVNILQQNGWYGAVDPLPYMEDVFAPDFAGLYKKVKNLLSDLAVFLSDKLRK